MQLWKTIEKRAKSSKAPALIYQEAELPLRVTRDLFTGEFERLVVDHDRTYKRIVGYLKKTSPHMVERVTRYKERAPLMEASGVEQEIKSTLNRRVDLPSGGYLIFDYAEAFTVIDVNTGRFVGSRSKTSGARLEDTITKNNLEAVKEVVRQLRLRDIGGIIVIDFIDMANPKNRAQVEEALRTELERDRTKTYVVEISPLGLVEMTRQNVTDGPREVMTRKCPTCAGDGIVVSEGTTAVELERKLRGLVTPGSRSKAFKVEVNSKIASMLAGPGGSRIAELEELTKKRFFLAGLDDVHLDHFRVLGQGTVEKFAPESPVEVGQELELKLGELGLYDPNAGVGKVDGYDISVGGAAKLVGKKVRVRVTAVMDGIGYAERIGGDAGELPITAEGEAERPTRARRSTKSQEILLVADDEIEEETAEEEKPAKPARSRARKPAEPATDADETKAPDGKGTAAKAPSRPRKKPPVEAEGEAAVDETDAVAEDVEAAEGEVDGDGAAAPKKRTRRGTRGGRNRRRKPVGAAEETNGAGPVEDEAGADVEARGRGRGRCRGRAGGGEAHRRSAGARSSTSRSATSETTTPSPTSRAPTRIRPRTAPRPRPSAAAARAAAAAASASPPWPVQRAKRRRRRRRATSMKTEPKSTTCPRTAPSEIAPAAENGAGEDDAPSNEPEDDWTYTPMSEWGSLDADEK